MRSASIVPTPAILVAATMLLASCSSDSTAPWQLTYDMAIVSGSGQTDSLGATLPLPIVVRVTDTKGNPAKGMVVDFAPTAGSGELVVDSAITGSDGRAEARWILGTSEGEAQVYASLRGTSSAGVTFLATVTLPPLRAMALAVGAEHSCAITALHELYCWGKNEYGQLGDGTNTDRNTAVALPSALRFDHVAAGGAHTCAITTEGELYCWGRNFWGQIGDGSAVTRTTPTRIAPELHFAAVVASSEGTCALATSGAVYCWGFMDGTQSTTYWTPAEVSGGTAFRSLASSSLQVCGIGVDGKPYCLASTWVTGGLSGGDGYLWRPQPAPVPTLTSFAGGLAFMCGLDADAAAWCWGSNDYGQLGNGSTSDVAGAVKVSGGQTFGGLYSGDAWTCGVTLAGPTYCWGQNNWGVQGPVVNEHYVEATPHQIPTPPGLTFTTMGGGFYHMCGIGSDSVVYCWGGGFNGELGDGHSVEDFYHTGMPAPVVHG